METITIAVNNETGRKMINELQENELVTIVHTPDLSSLVFPGEEITDEQFKEWVSLREKNETISLKHAKAKWAKKIKQFLAQEK